MWVRSSAIWVPREISESTHIDIVSEALQRKNCSLSTDVAKNYVRLDA